MGRSLANRNEILSLSQNLTISLSEISKAINALSTGVQNVLNMNNDIYTKVQAADESSKKTDDILKFIQTISTQTNMLGINAAIEAARAGELGKGFTVVASEIRKLSSSTSESVKQIDVVLKSISSSINNISSNINESNLIFEDQVATLEQIAASIEELNASSKSLISLSEKI
jgi:methyl-accepting chemotaxis protein